MLRNIALAALALLLPTTALAQGVVQGRITDAAGAPLPGAQVTARPAGAGAIAGEDGRFTLSGLPAGEHTLTASRIGYLPQSQSVSLAAGDTARVVLRIAEAPLALEGIDVLGQRRRIASATRTNTALIEIPQNIQVVGRDVIQQQAVLDLQDVVRNVSGITAAHSDQGAYQYFYARGFALDRLNNFRRNGTILFQWSDPFQANVEQVEVLKGPAGILFGDVEPGAVVNITTKKPLATPYRQAAVTVGEHGLVRPTLDVTGPLTPGGSLLYRLNASYERSESFRDVVESRAYFVAPALTWLIGDRTTWTVEGSYLDDWRVGDPGLVSPDGTVEGLRQLPLDRFLGEPGSTTAFTDRSLTSTLHHDLAPGWRLRHVAAASRALQEAHAIYLGQVTGGQVARSQFYMDEKYRNLTSALDLIGEFRTGPLAHEVLVGLDYSDSRNHAGPFLYRPLSGTLDLGAPAYGQADLQPQGDEWSDFANTTERLGVNLQDQLTLLDGALHVLLGLRYNRFTAGKQWFDASQRPEGEKPVREHPLSPRLGVVYQPAEWLSTYGSYSESYLVNGFDWLDPTRAVPPTYGKQLEVGVKGNLFAERLGFTLAAYDLRKEGVYGWAFYSADNPAPTPEAAALGWYTYSGAEHASRGVELDFHGRVTERLGLTGSAGYVRAEIVDDPAYQSGNELKNTPAATGSLWASYRPAGAVEGLELGAGVFYRDGFYGSNDNSASSLAPASTTADLAASYTRGRWRAQLNVKNLTDETSYIGGFGGAWQPQWPRRVLLGLSATF